MGKNTVGLNKAKKTEIKKLKKFNKKGKVKKEVKNRRIKAQNFIRSKYEPAQPFDMMSDLDDRSTDEEEICASAQTFENSTKEDSKEDGKKIDVEQSTKFMKFDSPCEEPAKPALSYLEQLLNEKKLRDRIAHLSMSILAAPEQSVRLLKELTGLLTDEASSAKIVQLTLLSLMEIFKDIVPDYKIRQLTDAERAQQMKKYTKHMLEFEQHLLVSYRRYIEFLDSVLSYRKGNKKRERTQFDIETRRLASRVVCELLVCHHYFNYRSQLVALFVPLLDSNDSQISTCAAEAAVRLFSLSSVAADATLDVVGAVSRLVKCKQFNVQPTMISPFTALRIREVAWQTNSTLANEKTKAPLTPAQKEKLRMMSIRERKRKKEAALLDKEIRAATADVDLKKLLHTNTRTIEAVFVTYFRILKHPTPGSVQRLLGPVLEGLASFSHLINVEFFDDLLSTLSRLVDSQELTARQSLHAIQTAMRILSGQGSALSVDPARFYRQLYTATLGGARADVALMLDCVKVLLVDRRRQVPPPRAVAFAKRLATSTLQQTTPGATVAHLVMLARVMQAHSIPCEALRDAEPSGSGRHLPEVDNPDLANAATSALWEAHALRHHPDRIVRELAADLLKVGAPVPFASLSPEEIIARFSEFDPMPSSAPSLPTSRAYQPHAGPFHDPFLGRLADAIGLT